jgi:hypothetical protein
MTWYADHGTCTDIASASHVRSIGWLDREHPFPTGSVPPEFVARLHRFVNLSNESADALGWGTFCGGHECQFCESGWYGFRNIGIPSEDVLFVAPELVWHYVAHHGYEPPSDFIAAVMSCPLPDTDAYRLLALPFRRSFQQERR